MPAALLVIGAVFELAGIVALGFPDLVPYGPRLSVWLRRVLHVYIDHYNTHRPNRALGLRPPTPEQQLRLVSSSRLITSTDENASAD